MRLQTRALVFFVLLPMMVHAFMAAPSFKTQWSLAVNPSDVLPFSSAAALQKRTISGRKPPPVDNDVSSKEDAPPSEQPVPLTSLKQRADIMEQAGASVAPSVVEAATNVVVEKEQEPTLIQEPLVVVNGEEETSMGVAEEKQEPALIEDPPVGVNGVEETSTEVAMDHKSSAPALTNGAAVDSLADAKGQSLLEQSVTSVFSAPPNAARSNGFVAPNRKIEESPSDSESAETRLLVTNETEDATVTLETIEPESVAAPPPDSVNEVVPLVSEGSSLSEVSMVIEPNRDAKNDIAPTMVADAESSTLDSDPVVEQVSTEEPNGAAVEEPNGAAVEEPMAATDAISETEKTIDGEATTPRSDTERIGVSELSESAREEKQIEAKKKIASESSQDDDGKDMVSQVVETVHTVVKVTEEVMTSPAVESLKKNLGTMVAQVVEQVADSMEDSQKTLKNQNVPKDPPLEDDHDYQYFMQPSSPKPPSDSNGSKKSEPQMASKRVKDGIVKETKLPPIDDKLMDSPFASLKQRAQVMQAAVKTAEKPKIPVVEPVPPTTDVPLSLLIVQQSATETITTADAAAQPVSFPNRGDAEPVSSPKTLDYEHMIKEIFPGAIPNDELRTKVVGLLLQKGFTSENTLLATSLCADELARRLETEFRSVYGSNFNLGGLAGFPFAGKTGFGAMAAHIPDDGSCLLLHGPHVGIAKDGTVGKVERPGMALVDNCCGSAIAASNYVQGIVDGDAPVSVNVHQFSDFQQDAVQQLILPYGQRLAQAENRMKELPLALYESQSKLIRSIILEGAEGIKQNGLALLGGIQINTAPDTQDYFLPLRFDYIDYDGKSLEDMLPILVDKK